MKYIFSLILILSLSACGSGDPSVGAEMIKTNIGRIGKGKPKVPTAEEIRATATPKALAKIGRPVMLAELPGVGLADILIFVQANAPYTTWASTDGVSFIFNNGVLTGTRGMGFDLMTADVEEVIRALQTGTSSGVRVHRYLDGETHLQATAFQCTYRRQSGGIVNEACYSRFHEFENQYILNSSGNIVKSRQWIGPNRGYLISERLS